MTNKFLTSIVLLSVVAQVVMGLYSSSSPIQQLTSKTFDSTVKKGIWLVEFYAPWCGHCKNLAPEYEKAAKALKGIANIAAIDGSNEKVSQSIQGYPTIKFYVDGKSQDYQGERTASGIISFVLAEFKKIANDRLSGKGSSGSKSSGNDDHGRRNEGGDEKDVIVLTDSSFDEEVLESKDGWFVQFYAPWCGHCQQLAPEWAALATTLKGQVKVAKMDATAHKSVPGRFGVNGYPTIKFFPPGKKDDSSAMDYSGARNEAAMAEWARSFMLERSVFQHTRITSQQIFDDNCQSKICVIAFLPHHLDCSKAERDTYLETYKGAITQYRSRPVKFLWAQAGDLFDLQEALRVSGVGYPAVVFVFQVKKVTGRMMGAYKSDNLVNFFESIVSNKVKMTTFPQLPKIPKVKVGKEWENQGNDSFAHKEELCTEEKANCGKSEL